MGTVTTTIAAKTDVGRKRDHNEDAHLAVDLTRGANLDAPQQTLEIGERGILLAVSDGMGGHEAGEVASAMVVESLRAALLAGGPEPIEKQIEAAVQKANQQVRDGNRKGMGATLTAVVVLGTDAYFAEVGDSRAYLLREGRMRQVTRDQSLVQMLVEGGVLTKEDARNAPQKNVILQAMGLAAEVRVAIARLELKRGDRILICCDGLSNAMTDDELGALVGAHEPEGACAGLIDRANERGGEDNLTGIVAHFTGPGLAVPSPTTTVTASLEVLQEFTDVAKPAAPAPAPAPAAKAPAPAPLASTPAPSAGGSSAFLILLVLLVGAACAYFFARR